MEQGVMTPQERAMAMQLLGGGMANRAGGQVDPNMRAALLAEQEAAAMGGGGGTPMSPQAAQGGPVDPRAQGGPVQGYMPQGIPKPNGGRMTPEQARKLAEMLRNR